MLGVRHPAQHGNVPQRTNKALPQRERRPAIKAGATGGETAGKPTPQAIRDAAKAENPLRVCVFCRREGVAAQVSGCCPLPQAGRV
jgi:hypothetical protein